MKEKLFCDQFNTPCLSSPAYAHTNHHRPNSIFMSSHEKKDFDQIINTLEDNFRHDLAVHLYLTFLSHRVNPGFPGAKWASWPVAETELPDLMGQNEYEDLVEAGLFEDETEEAMLPVHDVHPISLKKEVQLFSKNRVSVESRSSRKTKPKTLLFNELHALIQQKIHRKVQLQLKDGVELSLDDDNELTRQMALKLANRLHGVLEKISRLQYSGAQRNWQDVLLASVLMREHGEAINIETQRKAYSKAKRIFRDIKFNYEYSLDHYDIPTEENNTVPFDVNHHLEALNEQEKSGGKKRRTITPPTQALANMAKQEEHKESVFNKLCTDAENALHLSWNQDERIGEFKAGLDLWASERAHAIDASTLDKWDYMGKT